MIESLEPSDELVQCPYCGEAIELSVDGLGEDGGSTQQNFIEDCWVCCRPIAITASLNEDGEQLLDVRRLDD